MQNQERKKKNRLVTLDHLRGFFIITLIVDHLSRFPSFFALFSGKALVWVTAAEGFVAISGLLVGYVRGYKNRHLPLKTVSRTLIRRGILLYVWSLIASIVYISIIWYVPLQGGAPGTPFAKGDWVEFLAQLLTMRYTFVWVFFLTFYAVFLAISPLAIWLFRKNLAWVVGLSSLALLVLGWMTKVEILQWQFLFFIPSIVGFYLQNILNWWHAKKKAVRVTVALSTVAITVATITLSVIFTYYSQSFADIAQYVNSTLFAKDSISPLRAITAFVWFTGYVFIFHALRTIISKAFNWLLIPVGTHSLTAYILHGVAIGIVSFFTSSSDNFLINTLLGAAVIVITWALIKIPFVRRVIPA